MTSLDPQIESPPFFMPPGHFIMDHLYGFRLVISSCFSLKHMEQKPHCPSLVLSAEIYQTRNTFQEFKTKDIVPG